MGIACLTSTRAVDISHSPRVLIDKITAATYAYTSTAFPMLTGTLVTIAGFVPVGFAKSGAGEYCFSLFAVVGIALLVSWIVAVLFTPLTGVMILPDTLKKHGGHGGHGGNWFSRLFRASLDLAMRARWVVLGATADYVEGYPVEASRALLARLRDWATQPQFVYRHQWQRGDLLIWSNTGTMHRALPYALDSGRLMHRTILAGEEPLH